MAGASLLSVLLWAGIGLTAIFVLLMVWKSLISLTEQDVVILDPIEAGHAKEQDEHIHKVVRLALFAKIFGLGALVFFIASGALYLYQGLSLM
jgi:hypothetical protein